MSFVSRSVHAPLNWMTNKVKECTWLNGRQACAVCRFSLPVFHLSLLPPSLNHTSISLSLSLSLSLLLLLLLLQFLQNDILLFPHLVFSRFLARQSRAGLPCSDTEDTKRRKENKKIYAYFKRKTKDVQAKWIKFRTEHRLRGWRWVFSNSWCRVKTWLQRVAPSERNTFHSASGESERLHADQVWGKNSKFECRMSCGKSIWHFGVLLGESDEVRVVGVHVRELHIEGQVNLKMKE